MENSPPSFHRHRISLRPISTLKNRRNFFKWITRSKKSSKLNNLIRKSIHPLILRTTKYPVSSFQFPSRHVSVDQDSLISRETSNRSEGRFSIRNGTNWLLDTLEERIIFSREDYRANFLAETRGGWNTQRGCCIVISRGYVRENFAHKFYGTRREETIGRGRFTRWSSVEVKVGA